MNGKDDKNTIFGYRYKRKLEQQKAVFDQVVQVGAGLAAGIYFTAKEKPLCNPPENGKFVQENRQKFADRLAEVKEDPDVMNSKEAMRLANMLEGQNNTQEKFGQPIPENTVEKFIESIKSHAELDKKYIESDGESAPYNEHRILAASNHIEVAKAFAEAGCPSGAMVHTVIAAPQEILFQNKLDEIDKVEDPDENSKYGLSPW